MRSEVAAQLQLQTLRYSAVWEDAALLEQGLDLGGDSDVLSICSAGDNVLALLLQEPRSVTALDMSPAQIACLELKLAGIRLLDHPDFAVLMGVRPGSRLALYERVRALLSAASQAWWDGHAALLDANPLHGGRLEAYFAAFRNEQLPGLWPADLLERMLGSDLLGQRALFDSEGDTPAFRDAFRLYFGRENMEKQGRDPAQFAHVDGGDPGRWFLERASWAFRTFPLADNPYVQLFFTGRLHDLDRGPAYLRPANFPRLRSLVDRVRLHTGELEQLLAGRPAGAFSHGNLSDAFEYMSPELAQRVFGALGEGLRPGGRIAWWNLLVPREADVPSLRTLPELSQRLWARDRSWFYRAFFVAEVLG